MENDELYPAGWRYRKFYAARAMQNKNNTGRVTLSLPIKKTTVEKEKEVQVINQETMATALQEALQELAWLKAKSAGQELGVAPAGETWASPAVAIVPLGGREGAHTAQ